MMYLPYIGKCSCQNSDSPSSLTTVFTPDPKAHPFESNLPYPGPILVYVLFDLDRLIIMIALMYQTIFQVLIHARVTVVVHLFYEMAIKRVSHGTSSVLSALEQAIVGLDFLESTPRLQITLTGLRKICYLNYSCFS